VSRADEELLQLAAHAGLEEVALLRDPEPRRGTGLSARMRMGGPHQIGLFELGESLRPDLRQRAGSPLEHADSVARDERDPCRVRLVERDAEWADVCARPERGTRRHGAAGLKDDDLAAAEGGEEREIPRPTGQDRAAHVLLDRSERRVRRPAPVVHEVSISRPKRPSSTSSPRTAVLPGVAASRAER